MQSIVDGTQLSGCRMPRTIADLPYANLDYIFLPSGAWFLTFSLEGYYPGITKEVKSAISFAKVRGSDELQVPEKCKEPCGPHLDAPARTCTHLHAPCCFGV